MNVIKPLIAGLLLATQPLYATEAVQSQMSQSNGQYSATQTLEQKKIRATQWGLSLSEWQRYETILQGPKGTWYSTLDPTHVLGLDAKSDEERRKYARLQVEVESARVSSELAFQRAFHQAQKEMYPDLLPIDNSKFLKSPLENMLSGGQYQEQGRAIYFVDLACEDCRYTIQKLIRKAGSQWLSGVDFYILNTKNKRTIIDWATQQKIPTELVNRKLITLNIDNGTYQKLTHLGGDKLYLQARGKVEILPETYL
ncbi:TIGR03759 family integrating conjugative element protein [Endozoicomonas sp. SM1973]|uniref:TIGR03759 family integrating conjugative element protein n=1 Tax=Spartinivicinus marinus TaxID=2994442 RepID=A0A853I7Y8_9GAMM|nr:TIGR03759 family integrating conjugative element protein [Spartinivicinus marinus]MCX4030189.1 TIGR03759 family integrating conjugative element protein [Spartinivicinus marinus]NYZ67832.1 TIGR03759 family integrating conjugative element protein [Spartinivicinus marinus]